MLCIKSNRLINYLWLRGCIPAYETPIAAYYRITEDLYMLLEAYYIRFYCIPNEKEVQKMELALFANGVCVGALFVIIYDLCCLAAEQKRNRIEEQGILWHR